MLSSPARQVIRRGESEMFGAHAKFACKRRENAPLARVRRVSTRRLTHALPSRVQVHSLATNRQRECAAHA